MKCRIFVVAVVAVLLASCTSFQADYYVGDTLWKTQNDKDFADPGIPITAATRDGKAVFDGWYEEGSNTPTVDWTTHSNEPTRYNARFIELIRYYVNGNVWKTQKINDFKYPGEPAVKEIARGYEFEGWVPVNDYVPYEDWDTVPSGVRRFDALFSQTLLNSGIDDVDTKINLNTEKDFTVLGPVSVEETYEVVGDEVKVGGVSYKDILDAAIELYPDTDQVINIVIDYDKQELSTDLAVLNFETACYTGLAIDIE